MVDDAFRGRHYERIQYPALTAVEREAVSDAANILAKWLEPGERSAIIAYLGRRAMHSTRERSEAEWRVLFEDYADDLAEFSARHVQEAIVWYRRTSNFFPSIAELRKRCLELRERDKWRLQRAKRMLRESSSAQPQDGRAA